MAPDQLESLSWAALRMACDETNTLEATLQVHALLVGLARNGPEAWVQLFLPRLLTAQRLASLDSFASKVLRARGALEGVLRLEEDTEGGASGCAEEDTEGGARGHGGGSKRLRCAVLTNALQLRLQAMVVGCVLAVSLALPCRALEAQMRRIARHLDPPPLSQSVTPSLSPKLPLPQNSALLRTLLRISENGDLEVVVDEAASVTRQRVQVVVGEAGSASVESSAAASECADVCLDIDVDIDVSVRCLASTTPATTTLATTTSPAPDIDVMEMVEALLPAFPELARVLGALIHTPTPASAAQHHEELEAATGMVLDELDEGASGGDGDGQEKRSVLTHRERAPRAQVAAVLQTFGAAGEARTHGAAAGTQFTCFTSTEVQEHKY
jgi:hypothetical protein